MNIPISLPLDTAGFLRRECPRCHQQFKLHIGLANAQVETETDEQPPTIAIHCPICGIPSEADMWDTAKQIKYAQEAAVAIALNPLDKALSSLARVGKSGRSGRGISIQVTSSPGPDPLVEPNDMDLITSPCHTRKPIKVPEHFKGPAYCVSCGQQFTL